MLSDDQILKEEKEKKLSTEYLVNYLKKLIVKKK
jgi:hypothetical protein